MDKTTKLEVALKKGRSNTTEFLPDASTTILTRTICAMANSAGGNIYVGVNQNSSGDLAPVGVDPQSVERITDNLMEYFDSPLPSVHTQQKTIANLTLPVVVVNVNRHSGKNQIALSDLMIWKRSGTENTTTTARARPNRTRGISAEGKGTFTPKQKVDVEIIKAADREVPSSKQPNPDPQSIGDPAAPTSRDDGTSQQDVVSILTPTIQATATFTPPDAAKDSTSHESTDEPPAKPSSSDPATRSYGDRCEYAREATEGERALNVDDYAEVLANLFDTTADNEMMSFAIYGRWGRGKTFLAGRIGKLLKSNKEHAYTTVNFSAWKYRTTPETWAYLFQKILGAGQKDVPFLGCRAALLKNGVWRLNLILVGILISLVFVNGQTGVASWLALIPGSVGVLWIAFDSVRFQNAAVRLLTQYSFSGHKDKLGLQATIGDDLLALLQAWIPRESQIPKWPVALSIALCLLISVGLGLVLGNLEGPRIPISNLFLPAIEVYPVVGCIVWTIFWVIAFSILVLPAQSSKKRVLLVVDDLDRCESTQMLEIIESTMLILDDPEIRSRLQILMLIDETAFHSALLKKYHHLMDDSLPAVSESSSQHRIIRENQEKFFLAHLRLSTLSPEEISTVAHGFVAHLNRPSNEDGNNNEYRDEDSDTSTPHPSPDVNVNIDEPPKPNATSEIEVAGPAISDSEMKDLLSAIESHTSQEGNDSIGPRTIRCVLFRYQLAREILKKLNRMQDTQNLPNEIVAAYFDHENKNSAVNYTGGQVVKQVS